MLEAEGGPCFLVSIISWRRANKLVFSWAFYPVKHVQLLWSFTSVLLTSPSVNLWWSCWLFLFAYFSNFMATLLGYQEWHANQAVASLSASCCQTTPLQLTSHRWHGLIQVQAFWYLCKQHTPQCLTVLLLLLFFLVISTRHFHNPRSILFLLVLSHRTIPICASFRLILTAWNWDQNFTFSLPSPIPN